MKHYYALWVVVILMGAASVFALIRVQEVQGHQNDALRSILCHAEGFVRADKQLSPEQKRQSINFYESSLLDAHLASCDS